MGNLRAQCYLKLRDRVYRTFKAVSEGKMTNPDELISFASTCENLTTLRAELCRMPIKPRRDGLFELYTKKEMREKFKVRSPNCADTLMMSERIHDIMESTEDINFASFY
jgi:phage terminase large subunit